MEATNVWGSEITLSNASQLVLVQISKILGTATNALYKLFFQRFCFAGVAHGITYEPAILLLSL